jgi:hypothetical protein
MEEWRKTGCPYFSELHSQKERDNNTLSYALNEVFLVLWRRGWWFVKYYLKNSE